VFLSEVERRLLLVKLIKNTVAIDIPIVVTQADSFTSRFLGLMLRKSMPSHEALLLAPCNSIHMFFVRFPIDVVFLDEEHEIKKMAENLRPWRIIPPVRSAHAALELPAGSIKRFNMVVGDRLDSLYPEIE
jgi:uncharacterized membrane protein (UPF0127 family)